MNKPEIKTLKTISRIASQLKRRGKKIVTTNGCFDILHIGHVRYLQFAKSLGDVLIVGVNSDESVRKNKGPNRPIVPAKERTEILANLKPVDYVFIFEEKTPLRWLAELKPDIHVKGADRKMSEIIEKEMVEKSGGRVVLAPFHKDKSTTKIIKKISGQHQSSKNPL